MNAVQAQTFKQEIEAFRKSNQFTPGDPASFTVKISDEITLPGKYDPAGYLSGYGVQIKGNVAIVCGANGGLALEASRRGAASVTVFEPRNQFFVALDRIAAFFKTATDKTVGIVRSMPTDSREFDVIIWSEGLEQLRDPILPLRGVLARLAPGGKLYIEVTHGTSGPCPAKINAWRPTPQGFEDTVKVFPDVKIALTKKGRKDLRTVYVIESTKPIPVVVPVETMKAFQAEPTGPLAIAAGEPTVLTPKKAQSQPKPKQDPPPAPPPAPSAEEVKPKRGRRPKANSKPPEAPAGPAPTPA